MPQRPRCITLLLAVTLAGCARQEPPAATTPSLPPRIAVLSPALAVTLADLGLRDDIVGRHGWDMILDPSVPVCGEQNAIDYEALLRVRPTHVLTEWGARALPARLTDLAQSSGWVTHDFRLLTLEDIDASVTTLEALFPAAAPSARAQHFHRLATETPPLPRWDGRVLLLMSAAPIAALGPGSAHQELLLRVGGRPAITEGSPYMTLHAEDVLRLAPDAIVLIQSAPPDADAPPEIEALLGVVAKLDIPATRQHRIRIIRDRLALLPSTALADIADELAGAIDAWSSE